MAKGRAKRERRSPAQREWNAAVGRASSAWEYLSDEQRRLWNVAAKELRTNGQRHFVGINARRLWNGQDVLTEPPGPTRHDSKRVLKRLVITNRRGRIVLKLQVSPVRGARYTVWGSRPCNRGLSGAPKCPRLGPLPPLVNHLCEITSLYFLKHGPYIDEHRLLLPGKRIYIRLRQEFDEGPGIYQQVRAIVPGPQDRATRGKKP